MGVSIKFTLLEGETAHHGGGVCVLLCVGTTVIWCQFLCTNPMGWEFFVPAGTDLGVKLLILIEIINSSFNDVDLLRGMLADCCVQRHRGEGAMTAVWDDGSCHGWGVCLS